MFAKDDEGSELCTSPPAEGAGPFDSNANTSGARVAETLPGAKHRAGPRGAAYIIITSTPHSSSLHPLSTEGLVEVADAEVQGTGAVQLLPELLERVEPGESGNLPLA